MIKECIARKSVSLFVFTVLIISLLVGCSGGNYEKTIPPLSSVDYESDEYVKFPPLSEISVRQSDIDAKVEYAMMSILLENADHTVYTEEGSASAILYDTVNISYSGIPSQDGVTLSDSAALLLTNAAVAGGTKAVIGSGIFVGEYFSESGEKLTESFESQLIGVSVGETTVFEVIYPSDYEISELRNVKIKFTVTINSLARPTLAELTDEICFQYTGYKSVEEYRSYVTEYYTGEMAYAAVIKKCEKIADCEEILKIYIEKYIHEKIIYSYGTELTEREYSKAYEDIYSALYDEAYQWALPLTDEYVQISYLLDACSVTLSDKEFDSMLEAEWKANKDFYLSEYKIPDKESLVETLGHEKLEMDFKYEKLIKVLPSYITIIE